MLWTKHCVDFSTALQRQNLCLVYHLLPRASFFIQVTPPPWRLLSGPTSARRFPEPSPHTPSSLLLGAPPAACCWPPLSIPLSQHSSWVTITRLLALPFSLHCEFCEERSLILYLLFQQTTRFFSSSCWCSLLHCVPFFAAPRTIVHQAPLSMGFPRQEYWGGFPFLSPGDLLNPGIEPGSPALQADSLLSEPPGKIPQ